VGVTFAALLWVTPAAASAGAPAGYSVSGIDVSVYQGTVDWRAVAATGIGFAYIRASEQAGIPDANFVTNYANARARGLLVGAYHRARPDASSGKTQADQFLARAQFANDGKTLPPALDLEWPRSTWTPSGESQAAYACYNMTPAQLVTWTRAFLAEIAARTGRLGVVYTHTNWWKACTRADPTFGRYPLWWSYSASQLPLPAGWSNFSFWQYSNAGTVPGITENVVDLDVFRGDRAALTQLAQGSGYHELTSNGDVQSYGLPGFGSDNGKLPTGVTAVGIAASPATGGYWILKSNGGVDNFNAPWSGSLRGQLAPGQKVTGITATRQGGYLVVTSNGGVHNYGTPWYGSDNGKLPTGVTAVGIAASPATGGYWILKSNGGVDNFNAPWYGSLNGQVPAAEKVTGVAGE
jgi:GH25 family lysozyme M1 (1,4-beta-N-acetylmuramidase)